MSFSKKCEVYKVEYNIQKIKVEKGIPYNQAKEEYERSLFVPPTFTSIVQNKSKDTVINSNPASKSSSSQIQVEILKETVTNMNLAVPPHSSNYKNTKTSNHNKNQIHPSDSPQTVTFQAIIHKMKEKESDKIKENIPSGESMNSRSCTNTDGIKTLRTKNIQNPKTPPFSVMIPF